MNNEIIKDEYDIGILDMRCWGGQKSMGYFEIWPPVLIYLQLNIKRFAVDGDSSRTIAVEYDATLIGEIITIRAAAAEGKSGSSAINSQGIFIYT